VVGVCKLERSRRVLVFLFSFIVKKNALTGLGDRVSLGLVVCIAQICYNHLNVRVTLRVCESGDVETETVKRR